MGKRQNRKSGTSVRKSGNGNLGSSVQQPHPRRVLHLLFNFPGLVEAIATDPSKPRPRNARSTGYGDSSVWDLQIDREWETKRPYAWMSTNFEYTYPLVIWGLKYSRMNDELFDVPQACLRGVPLHIAFSWAYYHFILEDGKRLPRKLAASAKRKPQNLARTVLAYSLNTL